MPSRGKEIAQTSKLLFMTSTGTLSPAAMIHSMQLCLEGTLIRPAAVNWCSVSAIHVSYCNWQRFLKGLFQLTSGACRYLVHPPGT